MKPLLLFSADNKGLQVKSVCPTSDRNGPSSIPVRFNTLGFQVKLRFQPHKPWTLFIVKFTSKVLPIWVVDKWVVVGVMLSVVVCCASEMGIVMQVMDKRSRVMGKRFFGFNGFSLGGYEPG
jgi:hypothetical protein